MRLDGYWLLVGMAFASTAWSEESRPRIKPDMAVTIRADLANDAISLEGADKCAWAYDEATRSALWRLVENEAAWTGFYDCIKLQRAEHAALRDAERRAANEKRQQEKAERDARSAEDAALLAENYRVARVQRQDEEDKLDAIARLADLEREAKRAEREDAYRKEEAKQLQKDRQAAAAAKQRSEALKAECGGDYRNIQVGMSIGRAIQCVAPLKLTGQINRIDGVLVSSYESCQRRGCYSASVIEGTIAAWSRY